MTDVELRNEIQKLKTNCFSKLGRDAAENIDQLNNWKKLSELLKELIGLGCSTFEEKSDYISCQAIIKRISDV